jgi:hypothetical protein
MVARQIDTRTALAWHPRKGATMLIPSALLVALLAAPGAAKVQPAAQCLHYGGQETPENRDRSVAALAAARAINTGQAAFAAKQGAGRKYATREELQSFVDAARYNLSPGAEITPGFKLTLDAFDRGYWFEIVDTKDACGFRYVSNQSGLILAAQPIR